MERVIRLPPSCQDASKCIELKPDWAKGYSRLGAAKYGLKDIKGACAAYRQGLKLDPSSQQMKEALAEADVGLGSAAAAAAVLGRADRSFPRALCRRC